MCFQTLRLGERSGTLSSVNRRAGDASLSPLTPVACPRVAVVVFLCDAFMLTRPSLALSPVPTVEEADTLCTRLGIMV